MAVVTNAAAVSVSDFISMIAEEVAETVRAASDVRIEKESFAELSSHLEKTVPLLLELAKTNARGSDGLSTAVETLSRNVCDAKKLSLECGKRSKVYLLVTCRRIAKHLEDITKEIGLALGLIPLAMLGISSNVSQEIGDLSSKMARVEFRVSLAEEEILEMIELGIRVRNSDRAYANNLLFLIADAAGITREKPVLKREFDEFKKEIADIYLRKDQAEAIQMDQILALLGRADATLSFEEKEAKYHSKRRSLGSQPLEPLRPFYCPITQDVMEDPVETSSGQTFERSAIEKWFADGNATCPMTMIPLVSGVLRPNIPLKKSIEEWKERNTIVMIASLKSKLSSRDELDVLNCLSQLQDLCEDESNRECVMFENYVPTLIGLLSGSNSTVKSRVLTLLYILAKDSDDSKEKIAQVENSIEIIVKSLARRSEERKLAVALLLELSKIASVRDYIGKVKGSILLLVTISNSDNSRAANDAIDLLEKLSIHDENVVQMAKANYFKPLLCCLASEQDSTKMTMVSTLAEMELTDNIKAILFKDGALAPLLHLVSHGNEKMKMTAVMALQKLSSLPQNGVQMIRGGAVRLLLDLLPLHIPSSPRLQETVAATIMNLAISAAQIQSYDAVVFLESDDDIFQLFSLITLTQPNIQKCILCTFYVICQPSSAMIMRCKLRQYSGIQVLVPFCEHNDLTVRAIAVKLLSCLMKDCDDRVSTEIVGQKCLKTLLFIIQRPDDEEERAAAMGIISILHPGCTQITQWLIDAGALPIIVRLLKDTKCDDSFRKKTIENAIGALSRFTLSNNLEWQKRAADAGVIPLLVRVLLTGTTLTKQYAAISLAQFSENSSGLSVPIAKSRGFICCSPPPLRVCPVHIGLCSIEGTFCLMEAGAVEPLIRVLGEPDAAACGAALQALSTLMEGKNLQSGTKLLSECNAILPIIRLLNSPSTELQEKVLCVLERVFRLEEYKGMYGASAQMLLVDITQRGNGSVKALAARVLANLNVFCEQSSYF
uniref:RING-type E3 ubiquitin transferase n=1 Tax=Anthurium amnicola TaxID=1678845 RepID=A0A1D1YRL2_9ARAE